LLIDSLTKKLEDPTQKSPYPKEIIKLYDTTIQNVNEMSQLWNPDDEKYHKSIAAKTLTLKAFRCYFVAHSYYNASKWPETLALLQRTIEYTKSAIDHHEKCSPVSAEDINSLKALQSKVKGKRAAAHAKAFMESQPQAQNTEKEAKKGSEVLDMFDLNARRVKEGSLVDFPPDFEVIPCKPILFDVALTSIEFPDLTSRKKTKGFFGFWRM
jgi:signal recognition particle subunit SRP68